MRKNFSFLLVLFFIVVSFGCTNSKNETNAAIDVEFNVPESVSVEATGGYIEFKVLFGKAPVTTDKIILEDTRNVIHKCDIIDITSKSFTIKTFDGISSDIYKVSLSRGTKTKEYGKMRITIIDGFEPAKGTTVYGKVSCEGNPVANVVISDGVEVVRTDSEGMYKMKSQKKYGYVFISIPSGYEVATQGVLPMNYISLTKPKSIAERVDFNLFEAGDQSSHTILSFGDMHLAGGRNNDKAYFKKFCDDVSDYINSHKSEKIYAITLGDMTWDYYWYSNNYQFEQYLNDVNQINGLTIFHTIGNHDHDMNKPGDFDNVVQYMTEVAPDFYSFNIGKVHYIILDDILSTSTGGGREDRKYKELVTDEQLAWIAKDLEFVDRSYSVVIAMHATTGNLDTADNRNKLVALVKDFANAHFFTGHTHKFSHTTLADNCFDHNTGAVCADWWNSASKSGGKVNIGQDGGAAGYSIYTINGNEFQWQYKPTGIDVEYQFRTYDRNCVNLSSSVVMPDAKDGNKSLFDNYASGWVGESNSNEVFINVWNYGPGWSIDIKENGKSLEVTKADSKKYKDPLHLLVYLSQAMKSSTSETFATSSCGHMWKVTASGANSTLDITVKDPFGNTYTETMTRPKAFNVETYSR